jgi:GTP cyclohydrolase IA
MSNKYFLKNWEVEARAHAIAAVIRDNVDQSHLNILYGIPRGGIPAAYAVASALWSTNYRAEVTDNPNAAEVFIDDILDSGRTADSYMAKYARPFLALVNKRSPFEPLLDNWIVFPWENSSAGDDESATDVVVRTLQRIGEDPSREGLAETPRRVVKAWDELFSGYKKDPVAILKAFKDGAEKCIGDDMVIVKGIPIYSTCEHHMLPFFGTADIGYIPWGSVVGLSKLSRLADMFMRRLQVQERLTHQIADALDEVLGPKGVAVRIQCRHMCMEARGVKNQNSVTTTSAVRGLLKDNEAARAEFLELIK